MADYSEILRSLGDTEGFWQRETKSYKDFKNALTNLNTGMRAAGVRALNSVDVQKLRELAARAKEAWDIYYGQMMDALQAAADRGDEENPLPAWDKTRLRILNGMGELLEGDLNALRNYDPARNMNLPDIIQENRGLTADIRGKNIQVLKGNTSSRMVLEVNGTNGIFTEDYVIQNPAETVARQSAKYPGLADLLGRIDPVLFSELKLESAEQLEQKILNKDDQYLNSVLNSIMSSVRNEWEIQFPQKYNDPKGRLWFENPGFVKDFADAAYQIITAVKTTLPADLAQIDTGRNVPRRNAAMSMVADRLGMPHLLARSKVMKVKTDQGEKTGVFMEWADGTDLGIRGGRQIPELRGKPRKNNTADVIKSAADLQVLDYICGNTDRHGGNIFYRFEERDGVLCLVGLVGIDNDTSMGKKRGDRQLSKEATPDSMRVMTRSSAEAVLHMTKEDLRYSLYGLVSDEEIDYAWQRTEYLQNKIRESLKKKWKSDTSVRPGAIRILDDDSPVWGQLELAELAANPQNKEIAGVFTEVTDMVKLFDSGEELLGYRYAPHTRAGIRKDHYRPTDESTMYDYLTELKYPNTGQALSHDDIFRFYRNRKTLHNDPAAIQKGKTAFENAVRLFRWGKGRIHEDMGWTEKVDAVYIDGLPVAEYVKKYSPEHAGDKNYLKAQVMAALTSGRHHVDMVIIRTTDDGNFKVSSTELTMGLSALNGKEYKLEFSRETRRKSLIKDEDARIERQKAIEEAVLRQVNRTANRKVEELIRQDPVRNEISRTISYQKMYKKGQEEREKLLDQEAEKREKKRLEDLAAAPVQNAQVPGQNVQVPGQNAQVPGQNAQVPAQNVQNRRYKESVTLEALELAEAKERPRNRNAQNQLNLLQNPQGQVPLAGQGQNQVNPLRNPQNQPLQNQPDPLQNQHAQNQPVPPQGQAGVTDYSEVLSSLGNTEGFFQRETKSYKDFKKALTNLNNGMAAAGDHALNAGEVRKLRELAARAKEAWDIYFGQMKAVLLEGANREVQRNPLSRTDKQRMQILNGMEELLAGDLNALRNYDPTKNMNLPQIILENRGLTADIRGKNLPKVRGNMSSRLVMEVNGRKGVFTEDFEAVPLQDVYGKHKRINRAIAPLLEWMESDQAFDLSLFDTSSFDSPEDLAEKLQKGDMPDLQEGIENLKERIEAWNLPFPEKFLGEDGRTWLESPAFCRKLAEALFELTHAEEAMGAAGLASYDPHSNVPRRNAAMSAVADRLGVPGLIARSKVMTVKTARGDKTGVFMEWGEGEDLKQITNRRVVDTANMGKKRQMDSARVLKDGANLTVLDFICGNVDRHGGNMLYKFEEIDGVRTLVGLQGIDNDASFGRVKDGVSKLAKVDCIRVMTRSMAETVLNLTEEELKYSLYGLVKEDEIHHAWLRTQKLQDKIRGSMKMKWKGDHSLRPGAIRVLDDDSPLWNDFTAEDLCPTALLNEEGGVFYYMTTLFKAYETQEKSHGLVYQDHTRSGVRTTHYPKTGVRGVFRDLEELSFPNGGEGLSNEDLFSLYRNRRTLHGDQQKIQAAAQYFDSIMNASCFAFTSSTIHQELGMENMEERIYIDGLKASEYVRKYSPENTGSADYVKAQILAAVTSGRHHVDVMTLRTDHKGHFKAYATEITMDLSRLDTLEKKYEKSRENRRKSLIKDEDTRFKRQQALEEALRKRAEAHADRKVEELIKADPVRDEVSRTIPYGETYGKQPMEVERILDQRVEAREKDRLRKLVQKSADQVNRRGFLRIRNAFNEEAAPAPNVQGQAQNRPPQNQNAQNQAEHGNENRVRRTQSFTGGGRKK